MTVAQEAKHRYYLANREKALEYARKRYAPDAKREYDRQYRAANREKLYEKGRKYRAANPQKILENNRKWQAANLEKVRAANHKTLGYPKPTRPMPELCEANCGRRALCLDHCHVTNNFRGWLCRQCNAGIGQLGDTVVGLQRAITYLRNHQ